MTFLTPEDDHPAPMARAASIRLAVFDVDGVMTDGKLYLGPGGSETKTMHIHDGLGLKRLAAAGVEIAVISGRASDAVYQRLSKLGITEIHLGCEDKSACLTALQQSRQLEDRQIAVMGDDLPDLPLMARAGLALTVANGQPEVRQNAHWISTLPGGCGAVREACELIITALGK